MKLNVLLEILRNTSAGREEKEEFVLQYINLVNMAVMEKVVENLDQKKDNETIVRIGSLMEDMNKLKSSLSMGDEQKESQIIEKFVNLMKEVMENQKDQSLAEIIKSEVEEIDNKLYKDIAESLSEEDRKRILEKFASSEV